MREPLLRHPHAGVPYLHAPSLDPLSKMRDAWRSSSAWIMNRQSFAAGLAMPSQLANASGHSYNHATFTALRSPATVTGAEISLGLICKTVTGNPSTNISHFGHFGVSPSGGLCIIRASSGQASVYGRRSGGYILATSTGISWPLNATVAIVVTYTAEDGRIRFYQRSGLISSISTGGTGPLDIGSCYITLGAIEGLGGFLTGDIYAFGTTNRAVSEQEAIEWIGRHLPFAP